jgi:thiol-disulfide isomerase/thioredoxin
VVVLNFFYSTCPPCLKERDQIAQVARQFDGRVTVLGIDPVDTATTAQAFLAHGAGSVIGLLDPDWNAASAYNVLGFPTTYVIKADGTISAMRTGALTATELGALISNAG